jgi:AcrR family transcriptional regulator
MNAGRKREFDKQEALDKAMRVFWENGYSGTSVNDLTAALGINKPSLYSAFGNKEQLFRSAVDHYLADYGAPLRQKLLEPADAPLAERLRAYLYGIVDLVSSRGSPKGCLFVQSTCESGSRAIPEDITDALIEQARSTEAKLASFLQAEQSKGNLATEADVKLLAKYLMSVMYGLGVLVKNGSTRGSLRSVADLAIAAVPVSK